MARLVSTPCAADVLPRAARAILALAAAATLTGQAGCTLQEVTLAPPQDVLVAEVVLQVGGAQQFALLHRTVGAGTLTVTGASVQLTLPGDSVVPFTQTAGSRCVDASSTFLPDTVGTCYATAPGAATIVAGATYRLRIRAADGRQLAGSTTVPGRITLLRPVPSHCYLPPNTLLPIVWNRSPDAWVYMSETKLTHIRKALDPNTTNDKALDMIGLSISAADTTIVFPSEFGLFDRFEENSASVMLALQKGLPAGVTATVTIAAADRNYVQWVRQDSFNPSGQVRIPSLQGDGTGVFGSLMPARFDLTSVAGSSAPRCL